MGKVLREAIVGNTPFWVLTIFAIILLAVAFALPPTAIIDKSVLTAVSELMGFGALWVIVKAIDKGTQATLKHGKTSLTVNEEEKEEED